MDKIIKAVERAQGQNEAVVQPLDQPGTPPLQSPPLQSPPLQAQPGVRAGDASLVPEIMLNGPQLEANRIIAHDIADPRTKAFDMLRTQVLQAMDMKSWQHLGITSPREGCGKTVTAINLALSIARQPDRSVLLVDLDLQNPKVAKYLGAPTNAGLLSVLEGRSRLSNAIIYTRIRNERVAVLPCEAPTLRSSEWMASRSMSNILKEINRQFKGWTVILDMPPTLTSDDVITILPQIDCVLFVAAAGLTTVPEIKECYKHLETTPVVRVVLNKAPEYAGASYSFYPRHG